MNKVGPFRNPQETYKCTNVTRRFLFFFWLCFFFSLWLKFFVWFFVNRLLFHLLSVYSLPYCKPESEVETTAEGLGEALQGYELMKSAVVVRYTRKKNEQNLSCVDVV